MVLIRNKQTNLYYAAAGGWTPTVEKALTFPDAVRAYTFSKTCTLQNVEIVVKTAHGESTIPISDSPLE